MSSYNQQKYRKGEMEKVCEDFKSFKGCGKKILMKMTNEQKEDGSGFKWKKFELDGVTPHVHNNQGGGAGGGGSGGGFQRYQQPKQDITYNPQQAATAAAIPTSNDYKILSQQIAQMSLEVDSLKLRMKTVEEKQGLGATKESNQLTEMGVSKETRQDAGKDMENWSAAATTAPEGEY